MTFLYKSEAADSVFVNDDERDIMIKIFTPSIRGWLLPGEIFKLKTICFRILVQLMTLGRAKIFYAINENGDLMHTSYVIPHCAKFSFMGKDDYEIGPCYTYPDFRGKGIYPKVLHQICSRMAKNNSVFYMIVDENNKPSIKGIEKAGFIRCGTVRKSKLTKRYFRTE